MMILAWRLPQDYGGYCSIWVMKKSLI